MEFVTIIVTRVEKTKHNVGVIKQAVFLSQKAAKSPKLLKIILENSLTLGTFKLFFPSFFLHKLFCKNWF
jgi:hypothetical protein